MFGKARAVEKSAALTFFILKGIFIMSEANNKVLGTCSKF